MEQLSLQQHTAGDIRRLIGSVCYYFQRNTVDIKALFYMPCREMKTALRSPALDVASNHSDFFRTSIKKGRLKTLEMRSLPRSFFKNVENFPGAATQIFSCIFTQYELYFTVVDLPSSEINSFQEVQQCL